MADPLKLNLQMMEDYRRAMQDALSDLRCPEHGEAPVVIIEGDGLAAKPKIRSCCDPFARVTALAVQKFMRERGFRWDDNRAN